MKATMRGLAFALAMMLCLLAGAPAVLAAEGNSASEPVGQLKILARYNDSMQFFDGHVYLLFTSYRDGITITVDDLYAGYEINDRYYADIKKDISFGSNHNKTTTAADYFRENREMKSVTLNRGEIVTIGMYRAFDLSITDAALGTIQNSTIMKYGGAARDAAKTAVMENLFSYLKYGKTTPENAFTQFIRQLINSGINPNMFLDGTVPGGLCFNRELYNQKLEWDQYENASYALDITQDQLDRMVSALQGNLNKFSILKNSCATVALRAWNAAVGTDERGIRTAYYLESSGTGIFAYIDAPKTVKAEIMTKLPGYWLNNSEGVAEPGAGYEDETGWVYVSAPKKLDQDDNGNRRFTANSQRTNSKGKPVGRLTIAARHFLQAEVIAHSVIVFTPYQTMDLDISWYDYYLPTADYIALMEAYEDHPERFASDPALYSDKLPIADRASYFEVLHDRSYSAPKKTHLKAGESITISSYPHDENYLYTAINTLANGKTAAYADAMTLVEQMRLYDEGKKIDGPAAFDAMVSTLKYIYHVTTTTGHNPADGETEGGIDINREAYNQFVHKDNQFVYIYYTVELTAQELENLKGYLSDRNKNSYALFTNNCSSSVVELWNTALRDRPELAVYANLTNFLDEPESLCIALNNLRQKTGKEFNGSGEGGGTDYVLHIEPPYDRTGFDNVAVPSSSFSFKKVWEGGSEKSIDFTLYKLGDTVYHHGFDKREISKTEWQYNAWFNEPVACYVIEEPVKGYRTRYENVGVYAGITDRCCDGGTIVNYRVPQTGDEAPLMLWVGCAAAGLALMALAVFAGKRKKAHGR